MPTKAKKNRKQSKPNHASVSRNSGAESRAIAAKIIVAVVFDWRSLTDALADPQHYLIGDKAIDLSPKDQAFVQSLCFGCLRWLPQLRQWQDQLVAKPIKAKEQQVRALLWLGLLQLEYTRVPERAALSATVDAAKLLNRKWATGLLNAVLRRWQCESEQLKAENSSVEAQWAHPSWWVERIQADWPEDWQQILTANNEQAPLWLRVNQRQQDRATYRSRLADHEILSSSGELADTSLRLDKPVAVERLPDFFSGAASVQDESAQYAAQLLNPQAGDTVLDACAAPGGKTAHLLELADCQVDAVDISEERLDRVTENLQRLGLEANVYCADVTDPSGWDAKSAQYDRILLDAPCSASGVIRRHPDIKTLRQSDDIAPLVALQQQCLQALWPLLKPGGRMLYATCSVLKAENVSNISSFIDAVGDAKAVELPSGVGLACDFGVQRLPGMEAGDGFYYCLLEKA